MTNRFTNPPQLVELQLLRHGEAMNQLLSPLTDYMALCGDHESETVNVPLKHRALLTKLRALDYADSRQTQLDQLAEMADLVTNLLKSVPGIAVELSSCSGRLAHLSIATNAAEIAMVPFELALMPPGIPGAGLRMCLQPHVPVCMTRRTRNTHQPKLDWLRPVRILMIASDAGGEVPAQEHYQILRELVDPWLEVVSDTDLKRRQEATAKLIRLLVNPTVQEIHETVRAGQFTHIHILAHGASCDTEGRRYGVVLPSDREGTGFVVLDGEQLGDLIGYKPDCPESSPLAVTLAICQSARQGDVVYPGSSLAFELHNKGIPLVIGSQFPLTFGGSQIMTKELYRGFLNGEDPRSTIWKTRCSLSSLTNPPVGRDSGSIDVHDWASMTVYAQLPENLDQLLPRMEQNSVYGKLKTFMQCLDTLSQGLGGGSSVGPVMQRLLAMTPRDLEGPLERIGEFQEWIDKFPWKSRVDEAASRGILASAMKRLGVVLIRLARASDSNGDDKLLESLLRQRSGFRHHRFQLQQETVGQADANDQEQIKQSFRELLHRVGRDQLMQATRQYDEIFDLDRDHGWAIVQSLGLRLSLDRKIPLDEFRMAEVLNRKDLNHPDTNRRVWAIAALAELRLLEMEIAKGATP